LRHLFFVNKLLGMFQINTLNFRLSLGRISGDSTGGFGTFYIDLSGESPFDINKSFSERIVCNAEGKPFISLEDAAVFSEEMAAFWKLQLLANPKLEITSIRELVDLWKKFAAELYLSSSADPDATSI
jgi:hypothetical protein